VETQPGTGRTDQQSNVDQRKEESACPPITMGISKKPKRRKCRIEKVDAKKSADSRGPGMGGGLKGRGETKDRTKGH